MKIGKSYNAAKAGGIVAPPPKEVLGHHHAHGLTSSERHFLSLIADGGTIQVGSSVGANLYRRGLVAVVKQGRYGITQAGSAAMG